MTLQRFIGLSIDLNDQPRMILVISIDINDCHDLTNAAMDANWSDHASDC